MDGFSKNRPLKIAQWAFAVAAVIFLVAPCLIVIPMSFSASDFLEFPPRQFSLRWYETFWNSLTWIQAARASLATGALTVVFSVPLGTLAAYGMRDMKPKTKAILGGAMLLPAIVPSILVAIGLFFLLSRIGLVGSLWGVALGHTALALPVVFVLMSAAFAKFDRNTQLAAESLGAGTVRIWKDVIIPQISGSLIAAAVLAFVTSLDEVVVAMFISAGENATLPKVMFSALRDHIDPTVAAISSMLILVALAAVLVLIKNTGTCAEA